MISILDFEEIVPVPPTHISSPHHVHSGLPIPKVNRVQVFSPEAWEEFVEEWASSLKTFYSKVRRFGGAKDMGVDIAGFCSDTGFAGDWDNYQCKRYDHPLRPSDIWVEIGKIVYYAFLGEYSPPRRHYFVCSQDIGTSLEKLLNKPDELKQKTISNWEKNIQEEITDTGAIPLCGDLKEFLDKFDFRIFSSRSVLEMIEGHSKTVFHTVRFGGGLPPRPNPALPPEAPELNESRYIRQLLDAYGDHVGESVADPSCLDGHQALKRDFLRQRERFYHAESLRNFARDTVPDGTFDALQNEIFYGVVDVCEDSHDDGYRRMKATIAHSSTVAATSNPLVSAIQAQDRQGICHQLANDDRLKWVSDDDH